MKVSPGKHVRAAAMAVIGAFAKKRNALAPPPLPPSETPTDDGMPPLEDIYPDPDLNDLSPPPVKNSEMMVLNDASAMESLRLPHREPRPGNMHREPELVFDQMLFHDFDQQVKPMDVSCVVKYLDPMLHEHSLAKPPALDIVLDLPTAVDLRRSPTAFDLPLTNPKKTHVSRWHVMRDAICHRRIQILQFWHMCIEVETLNQITLALLYICGAASAGMAPYFLFSAGITRPLSCVIGWLSFSISFLLCTKYREKCIRLKKIPTWFSGLSLLVVGVGSLFIARFQPKVHHKMMARVVSGFSFVSVSVFCLFQTLQPPDEFGALLMCSLLPLQATLTYFPRFEKWYVISIVIVVLLYGLTSNITAHVNALYRREL